MENKVLLLSRKDCPINKKIIDESINHKPFVNKDLILEKKPSFSGSLFFQATIVPNNGNARNDSTNTVSTSLEK